MKKIIFPVLTGLTAFIGFFCGFIAIIVNSNVSPNIIFWLSIMSMCCFCTVFIFIGIQTKRDRDYAKDKSELKKMRLVDIKDVDLGLAQILNDGKDPSTRIYIVLSAVFIFVASFAFKTIIEYLGGEPNVANVAMISSIVFLSSFLLGYILASKYPKFIDKHNIYLLD